MLSPLRTDREFVVNGRFMAKPLTGVTLVGRETLRALLQELNAEQGRQIRIAAPVEGDAHLREWISSNPSAILDEGYAGNLGEQLSLPKRYPSACIISFCNTTPLLARRSIIWMHDSHVFDFPETYSRPYRLWHRCVFDAVRARKFDVVTVSQASRARLIELGVAPERINVIYNGGDHLQRSPVDPSALEAAGLQRAPFIFMVGSRAQHKNIPFAVETLLRTLPADMRIAVAGLGQEGPYGASREVEADPRAVRLPRLTDGQLRSFYQAASCVVTPSLAEGFGLAAAEALWEGAPQALSDRGALPEVGGAAALYFDPTNAEQMADQVRRCLDPAIAGGLRSEAAAQREKFTWRRSAREFIGRYMNEAA